MSEFLDIYFSYLNIRFDKIHIYPYDKFINHHYHYHHRPRPQSPRFKITMHLILLTCHAIYVSGPPELESSWLLAPFQKDGREHLTFMKHIVRAAELWRGDENSLLVVSGGCTRREVEKSESRGYFEVGVRMGVWGEGDLENGRIVLEEAALDSWENLVRGLVGFWRATGAWPGKISIVSLGFKRERFLELHCRGLGLGLEVERGGKGGEEKSRKGKGRGVEVIFEGINPDFMNEQSAEFDAEKCEDTLRGEREKGYGEWKRDLWGTGRVLRGKRAGRDCWGREGEERKLFECEKERARSGVTTRWLERGEGVRSEEVIEEGAVLPWIG